MKKIISFLILLLSFSAVLSPLNFFANVKATDLPYYADEKLVLYNGDIPHFFTHEIISQPKLAFSQNNRLSNHFDKDCITFKEFFSFLDEMYQKDYVLVDIYDVVGIDENNVAYFKNLYFPKGKKPMLLSFDDMSYDTSGKGLNDKIILTRDGQIASYTKNAVPQISYEKDSLPILENFIALHPDFSHKNARAIICPTGYNGILGYRINHSNVDYKKEIKKIFQLVKKLKKLGYRFASHTYNHREVKYIDNITLSKDLKQYDEKIVSVIGKTNIFCFPCGARTSTPDKVAVFNSFGYKVFLCVGL